MQLLNERSNGGGGEISVGDSEPLLSFNRGIGGTELRDERGIEPELNRERRGEWEQ